MAPQLQHLFRSSLDTGDIPDAWKHAIVTPVYKKGKRDCVSNYRPISLTSTTCKVMERLICDAILDFAMRTERIPKEQHGFIPGRSVTTNMLHCLNDWTRSLDLCKQTDVVYLDFSSAFDKVPHKRLLHKLHHQGIRGKLLRWIGNYLEAHTF